jgi:hypothetical protein
LFESLFVERVTRDVGDNIYIIILYIIYVIIL